MKNYVLLMLSCFVFANNQFPTQDQIDAMMHEVMQLIWHEAMNAKNAINETIPKTREELLDNLCSSAPAINFVTHADLSDDVTSDGSASASIFVSTDNQNSWIENPNVNPINEPGYESTWGTTTATNGGNAVDWYLWGSINSGSLGLDFGQITVSQSPYNSGNQWPPSSGLYATLLTDSSNDTGSGQDIINLRTTYSDDKLYASMGLEGSCCDEGGFFGPWNIYAIAIVNPDALDNSVAYAYAYGDGGFLAGDQLYPGIFKISGDFSSGVGEVSGFEILSTNFNYSTAGNNLQASSLLSIITNDADWGEWPNSYGGPALIGVVVQANVSLEITVLDATDPGLFVMSTQSQYSNTAPILSNPTYENGELSITYTDNENNLAVSHDAFVDDMGFVMVPDNHAYAEGVIFRASGISGDMATLYFSDGSVTTTLEVELDGGSCAVPGDANGDNLVNVLDIVLTTNLILCSDCPDDYNVCSDINGDLVVNVLDIVAIVNLILGPN